jgi:hypothetical protein
MHRRLMVLLISCVIGGAGPSCAASAGAGAGAGPAKAEGTAFRTWTTAGGATIEAEAVEIDAKDVVSLRRRDGQLVRVPLAQVSDADRAFLAPLRAAPKAAARRTAAQKLEEVVVPQADFRQANIEDVVDFLRQASGDFSPDHTPANFVLHPSATGTNVPPITLNATSMRLGELLKLVLQAGRLKYSLEDNVVMITGANYVGAIVRRTYALSDVGAAVLEAHAGKTQNQKSLTEFFTQLGVAFPEGAFVSVDARSKRLFAANTAENLTTFENILKNINSGGVGR